MKIAVASGKGGTGRTTVSINLALSIDNAQYLDCDVEEPNAAIFLKPEFNEEIPVEILVPVIDEGKCDYCRKCAQLCTFNALLVLGEKTMLFSLCSLTKLITEEYGSLGADLKPAPNMESTTRSWFLINFSIRLLLGFSHTVTLFTIL